MTTTKTVLDRYYIALGKRQRALRSLCRKPLSKWKDADFSRLAATAEEFAIAAASAKAAGVAGTPNHPAVVIATPVIEAVHAPLKNGHSNTMQVSQEALVGAPLS